MTEPPSSSSIPPVVIAPRLDVAFDDRGKLAQALECKQCGYNLQGLAPDDCCPECALPIHNSLRGDELRHSDPHWVRKLARGALLIPIGMVTAVVCGFFFSIASAIALGAAGGTVNATGIVVLVSFASASPWLITIYGAWLLTEPDPARTESEPLITARQLARWCLMTAIISVPLQLLGSRSMIGVYSAAAISPMMQMLMVTGIIVGIGTVIGYFALLRHTANLARRIPNRSLASQSTIIMWGFGISQSLDLIVKFVSALLMSKFMAMVGGGAPPTSPGLVNGIMVMDFGGCFVGITKLVFGIWGIVLLFRLYGQFGRSAEAAKTIWRV